MRLAATELNNPLLANGSSLGLSLRADVAVRVTPRLALGIHAGVATAQLTFDRSWIAPWIGASKLSSDTFGDYGDTSLGLGFAAGYSVYKLGSGDVDVFLSAMGSRKGVEDTRFLAFVFGVDVRLAGSSWH